MASGSASCAGDAAAEHHAKKRRHASAWPSLELTGPGGFGGEKRLKELCGDPQTLTGIFVATMGLNASWLLQALGLPPETSIPIIIACHHPERCWSGHPERRRVEGAVRGHSGSILIFPPFANAPGKADSFTAHRTGQAPRGLLGCVHAKMLIFYRTDRVTVVISTANMTRGQWVHTRNHLWSATFPARPLAAPTSLLGGSDECTFGSDLAMYVSANLAGCSPSPSDATLVARLAGYDFTESSRQHVHIVTSIPSIVPLRLATTPPGACATFRSALAGADHHRPSAPIIRAILRLMSEVAVDDDGCTQLALVPLPHNSYDPNAIGVRLPPAVYARLSATVAAHATECAIGHDGLIGYLPRLTAAWIAPLRRTYGLRFTVRADPRHLFSNSTRIGMGTLLIDVHQSAATFSSTSAAMVDAMTAAEAGSASAGGGGVAPEVALVTLLARVERPLGLQRLRQLLRPHAWPPAKERKAFFYASSSVGNLFTAVGKRFLQGFVLATSGGAGGEVDGAKVDAESADDDESHWVRMKAASTLLSDDRLPQLVFPTVDEVKRVCEHAICRAAYLDAAGNPMVHGRVRLHSLTSKPALNGRTGTITGVRIDGRVCVRLDRCRPEQSVWIHVTKLSDGPPVLTWPYMMSDKTWELCSRPPPPRGASHMRDADNPVAEALRHMLRNCDLKQFKLNPMTGVPTEDQRNGETALMHSKVAMRWWEDGSGWVYIGSHNFSPAAWGSPLPCDSAEAWQRGDGAQQLWVANWELGILRIEPPRASTTGDFWRGLRKQLGFKPGGKYIKDELPPPATQRRLREVARTLQRSQSAPAPEPATAEANATGITIPPLPPGEPLREVIVGVNPMVEWLPGQAGSSTYEHEDDDGEQPRLMMMLQERLNAECDTERDGRYALALVSGSTHN